jgi:phosphocarrier protein
MQGVPAKRNFYRKKENIIMVSKKFVVQNEQGLHMRPAGVLAKAVTKFESDVTIVYNDKKINAKSLLNIIGACIKYGSEIELVCEGPDEEAALAHATELIESGLGE